ncbi:hypothetical protein PCASD_03352 [Puccinia coronata f. sp. avenae]|uniref:Uncharacterized protein n=1 Tax=Puccinia coronata f. sp. avenae TaxID=200324 RepID=A0A2N5VF18_9BASI|nr:hypothetical protein PCASD_03352 [Puccinia coronata f. sp. avenae]
MCFRAVGMAPGYPLLGTRHPLAGTLDTRGTPARRCRVRCRVSCFGKKNTRYPDTLTGTCLMAAYSAQASSYCSCLLGKQLLQLLARRAAAVAACSPNSCCSCLLGKQLLQLLARQTAAAAACSVNSCFSCLLGEQLLSACSASSYCSCLLGEQLL